MKYFLMMALVLLSGTAVKADVTILNNDRNNQPSQPLEYKDSNGRTIKIYNGRANSGEALMMRDGKLTTLPDGDYVLPSGKRVNIKNGKMTGQFGNGQINNKVKIYNP